MIIIKIIFQTFFMNLWFRGGGAFKARKFRKHDYKIKVYAKGHIVPNFWFDFEATVTHTLRFLRISVMNIFSAKTCQKSICILPGNLSICRKISSENFLDP